LKRESPCSPVFTVSKGVPGRGLAVFLGVDISTGTCGTGVPATVTKTTAFVIEGLGDGDAGNGVGVDETELL